jgi:hypothetical protein
MYNEQWKSWAPGDLYICGKDVSNFPTPIIDRNKGEFGYWAVG